MKKAPAAGACSLRRCRDHFGRMRTPPFAAEDANIA